MRQETKQVTRTPYMERLMSETYSQCAINAVVNGTIEGAWEQAIESSLIFDFKHGFFEDKNGAITVAIDLGLYKGQETDWRKVAAAILNTKPPTK